MDEERDILRWGRNADKSPSAKRSVTLPKSEYRKSTAFECLVIKAFPTDPFILFTQLGVLYLSDINRLQALMHHLGYVKNE